MITATFSNGYTDTYKGTRAVKAAWMVVEKLTGRVVATGHSIDFGAAEKTAKSAIVQHTLPTGWRNWRKDVRATRYAKSLGYESVEHMESEYQRVNAEYSATVQVEVIAL